MLAVAGTVLAVALTTAGPAAAHAGDPTLVTRLTEVTPALPPGVTAELHTTVADELVVTNPTDTPLVAVDPQGAPFLRISASGVEGNLASPYLHLSAAPADIPVQVPDVAQPGAPERWVTLSDAPTWGWFDPRLSPQYLAVPIGGREEVEEVEELAEWTIPLRYGDTDVTVEGALVKRPVTGRFETTLDTVPAGLSALLGQGYVPSLSLQAGGGREVVVLGRQGEPYVRFGPGGAEVNRDSRTHREDLFTRGRLLGTDETGWAALPTATLTWADVRLRYPSEDPPAEFAEAQGPVDLARWEIPVLVDGERLALAGSIRWIPNGRAIGEGSPWTLVVLGGVALLLAGGVALVLRNRRLAAAHADAEEPEETPTRELASASIDTAARREPPTGPSEGGR
jgi:hypothetical protein